jgi:ATP-dependent protease HslVU (ClpYQ) peptidase subunit
VTCIAGIVHRGRVYMGGDSASTCGDTIQCDLMPKVFRRGEFVIGTAGDARLGDLMRAAFVPPRVPTRNIDGFMATKFVKAVQKCFAVYDYPKSTENEGESYSGCMLVGVRGRLYMIDGNFSVSSSMDGFDSIGTGAMVALGAFHATSELKPAVRLNLALKAASRVAIGVSEPFVIETT